MESKRPEQWQAWVESICREYTVRPETTGRFEPNPSDAFKLAALQWWTHEIGRTLIEMYATDRRQFKRMSRIVSDAAAALRSLAGEKKLMSQRGGCSGDPAGAT